MQQCHVCRRFGQMVNRFRVAAMKHVCCMCVDDLSLRKEVGVVQLALDQLVMT